MAGASDLLVIFLALEVMSLSVYVLTGIRRSSEAGAEAAFKYFLLGAFSSAFFLYGVAFTYGVVGSTRLEQVAATLASQVSGPSVMVHPGARRCCSSALPSRSRRCRSTCGRPMPTRARRRWSPASCPPASRRRRSRPSSASSCRPSSRCTPSGRRSSRRSRWRRWCSGTTVGVAQGNVKRMLAYSSIAHGGYLLVGLVAANSVGKAGMLFYLAAYGVTNVAAFGLMALLSTEDHPHDNVRDFAGLWHRRPGMAAADDDLPAVARRAAADGRLRRQVVRVRRRGAGGLLRPGHHRRAHQRRVGLLLPAHRRDDVHVRGRGGRPGAGRAAQRDGRPGPAPLARSSTSASCRPASSTSRCRACRGCSDAAGLRHSAFGLRDVACPDEVAERSSFEGRRPSADGRQVPDVDHPRHRRRRLHRRQLRPLLAGASRGPHRQSRQADVRGQPREPRGARGSARHELVRGDIGDRALVGGLLRTHAARGGGQLRRREPRRSVDSRARRRSSRRTWSAPSRCSTRSRRTGARSRARRATPSASCTSRPTRSTARSAPTIRRSPRRRRTRPTARTRRRRPGRTISCAPITTPTACRC